MYKTLLILSLVFFYYAIEAKTVKLDIDWAMFRYDENQVLCEMYYSFPDTLIKYNLKSDAGLYEGEIYFNITIKSSVNTVAEKEWIVTNSSALPVTEHKTDLVGQRNFLLSPGQYEVLIQLIDVNDGSTKADLTINLIVKKFNNNKIDISDIELAKYIEYKTETTVKWNESFKKGNLYVVPNPTHMCFGDNLNIKAYYEIYNSKHISPDGFIIKYRILDAAKREELMIKNDKVADRDVMLEIATLPVDILPTGVYYFETTILFPKDNPTDSVSESEQFYVLNPEIPPNLITNFTENVTFDKSEWVVMSDEQINTEFEKAKFIATPNEIELWKEISTVEAKQKFMYAFWNIRNQDTTKPYNEKLLEYRSTRQQYVGIIKHMRLGLIMMYREG
ncbi:MAG: hypothetical protein HZB41_09125 [Ignavibacteriae bacterium]|nr:hypothetical protein [Ignavibacteriota bacterium]